MHSEVSFDNTFFNTFLTLFRVIEKALRCVICDELYNHLKKNTMTECFRVDDTPAMKLVLALIKRSKHFNPSDNNFPEEIALICKVMYESAKAVQTIIDPMELTAKTVCLRIICPRLPVTQAKELLQNSNSCMIKIHKIICEQSDCVKASEECIESYGKKVFDNIMIDMSRRNYIHRLITL